MDGEIVKVELAGYAVYNELKKVFKTQTGWSKHPSMLFKKDKINEEVKKYDCNCVAKAIYYSWIYEY